MMMIKAALLLGAIPSLVLGDLSKTTTSLLSNFQIPAEGGSRSGGGGFVSTFSSGGTTTISFSGITNSGGTTPSDTTSGGTEEGEGESEGEGEGEGPPPPPPAGDGPVDMLPGPPGFPVPFTPDRPTCATLLGLQCPLGLQCVEDQRSGPIAADAPGLCIPLVCPAGPDVIYTTTMPGIKRSQCDKSACPDGSRAFFRRRCGCGCRPRKSPLCPREAVRASYTTDLRSCTDKASCKPTCEKPECLFGQRSFRKRRCGCGCVPQNFFIKLVGTNCERARRRILRRFRKRARKESLEVICIAENSPVTADFRPNRMRIFFNEDGNVSSIPIAG